ncbi:MAG: FMN-binding protein [Spirochaetales bacterium]|nr:FMN-binding protein [Spirochaetales bacterium]MCF7937148.1 FMN-binding protein [Spirochaetales bacterium]
MKLGIAGIALRLAVIAAAAALALGAVNSVTAPVIKERKARELQEALSSLVESGTIGDKQVVEQHPVVQGFYPVSDEKGEPHAYILDLLSIGYGGEMKLLAAFSPNGRVESVVLMENEETPGLGKKAENPEYMEKYIGTGVDTPVPFRKDDLSREEADAVTGATITFRGIGTALSEGSEYVKEQLP